MEVEVLAVHELFVLFWEMGFGHGSALPFLLSMNSLFEPVGDEGAFTGGGFVVGIHLSGVMSEHGFE